jgi:hypothetical protein
MAWSRGGRNPHMRTSQKKPCSKCGKAVRHYSDHTIEKHKIYEYKVVNGVNKKTSRWSYCPKTTW